MCKFAGDVLHSSWAALLCPVHVPRCFYLWGSRKHPRLLFTPPAALASRTLNLKLVLPTVDLRWVIRRAPWLLTEEVSHVWSAYSLPHPAKRIETLAHCKCNMVTLVHTCIDRQLSCKFQMPSEY